MKTGRGSRVSLFDLQVNGFAGIDFQQPNLSLEELRLACLGLRNHQTHRILLTLVTDGIDALERQFARIEAMRNRDELVRETVAGYHLEGPYLNPEEGYRGAHPAKFIKAPDWKEYQRLQKAAGGNIRLVTLAPEWPGSARFIAALTRSGVVVSLGHTNASESEIDGAVKAGAALCTHLGNGCPAVMPRHDNITPRQLARDDLVACFLPDGIHIPPTVLKNFLRAKPADQIIITTDAMAAAGAPPGRYSIGKSRVDCGRDGVVHFPGTEYFAGSSLTPEKGAANAARWAGVAPAAAWGWGSSRPAEMFGIRLPRLP